jgi:SAM-dependent methyltransferase
MSKLYVGQCPVCGGTEFEFQPVLWDGLVNEWQISPEERLYIDRQQGETCRQCGAKLRCMALAKSLLALDPVGATTLQDSITAGNLDDLRMLEINEAGTLHALLSRAADHTFACYPDVDMHALPFEDEEFDIVVHSDTLEHVQNPVHALAECCRVLRRGGSLVYTVPTIVGRMTRGREGLEASYHGGPGDLAYDYRVHTEFGADMWTMPLLAGFSRISIDAIDFPAAMAISAVRD